MGQKVMAAGMQKSATIAAHSIATTPRIIQQKLMRWATPDRILLANVIHLCILKYYASSTLQFVVAAFSCNTFVYVFVTLSPTVSRPEVIAVEPPATYFAVLYLYKEPGDKPLHAMSAELWLGQKPICRLEPIHCFGLTAGKIRAYTDQVLQAFAKQYGVSL
jgi:hypothetical protein